MELEVCAWDTTDGRLLCSLERLGYGKIVKFADNGSRVAVTESHIAEDDSVLIIELERRTHTSLRGHERPITDMCFNPDGSRVVTGSMLFEKPLDEPVAPEIGIGQPPAGHLPALLDIGRDLHSVVRARIETEPDAHRKREEEERDQQPFRK